MSGSRIHHDDSVPIEIRQCDALWPGEMKPQTAVLMVVLSSPEQAAPQSGTWDHPSSFDEIKFVSLFYFLPSLLIPKPKQLKGLWPNLCHSSFCTGSYWIFIPNLVLGLLL